MEIHEILRQRLLLRAGLAERPKPKWTMAQLEAQWNHDFEKKMRARLMMGALRYGSPGLAFGVRPGGSVVRSAQTDNPSQIRNRLQNYEVTGNAEWLVDVANFAMVEYAQQNHSDFHFESVDRAE